MIEFGTDGIRGIAGKDLTFVLAMHVGAAIAKQKPKMKVVIGRDNRPSGKSLLTAVSVGLSLGGANVTNIGISSTPCISYLTKNLGFDYGIEISASHNPAEYNGIKVFNKFGEKIDTLLEKEIEKNINENLYENIGDIGKIKYCPKLKKEYINFLQKFASTITKKVAIDCSNGSVTNFAKQVFKNNKNVIFVGTGSGKYINHKVGATNPNYIYEFVKKHNCEVGFAFDGDADRIVVVSQKQIYSGDNILLALAREFCANCVVGTVLSNYGLEKTLKKENKRFVRADVGDKNVLIEMKKCGANFGGEPAGHIICRDFAPTGDGLLVCLIMLNIFLKYDIDEILKFETVHQTIKNIEVQNKNQILLDSNLTKQIKIAQRKLIDGRIVVRASGTENKIRIMVESSDVISANQIASSIEKTIKKIEGICVE